MVTVEKREKKQKEKIFTKNEEAIRFSNSLKERGKVPYKYIIVTWDE
jgi:hypothetical protein